MMKEILNFDIYLDRLFGSIALADMTTVAVKLLFTVIIGLIVVKLIMKVTKKTLDKSGVDSSVYSFVKNMVRVFCVAIIVTVCLSTLGIPMSTVVAVFGAAGAAIALALKDSLANVAGGIMIITTRPFKNGDLVDVGDVSGLVEKIDLFLTTLKTYDNKTITIPNGLINTSIIVNHSKEKLRRVDCTFRISYKNDISKAKEVMAAVCEASPDVLSEPEPFIGVASHGDGAVFIDMKAWCNTEIYWDVKYLLEESIKLAFDENDIEIPYPQMDVHIKK